MSKSASNTPLLVTGASGFLGSHLVHLNEPKDVVGLYHANPPDDPRYNYRQLDLTDFSAVRDFLHQLQPKTLIHAAANSRVEWCEKNKKQAWIINTEASIHLAKVCAEIGCKMVFVSSDMVYDGEKGDYAENDVTKPQSHYGKTKRAAEQGVLKVNPKALATRVSLIYGFPVQEGRGSSFLLWLLQRLQNSQEAPLFFDQTRTPVEVIELAKTLVHLAKLGVCGVVNVGGGEKTDRVTFGKHVCDIFNLPDDLIKPTPLGDYPFAHISPKNLSLNTDRLAAILDGRLSDCKTGLSRIHNALYA